MAAQTILEHTQRNDSAFLGVLKKCTSFQAFLAVLLIGLNFKLQMGFRLEPDTFWHTRLGEQILTSGHWPTVDTWSFTVGGLSRLAYEWGGEVLMAAAWRLGGYSGMEGLMIVLTSIILLLLSYYAYLRCGNFKAAAVATVIILPVVAMSFTLRPQLLGYIFLLITLILLERFRLGLQKTLWLLPPLFLVWINTHGSFSLGFGALALYWLSGLHSFSWGGLQAVRWQTAQRIHLELICLASLIVLPITPYGTRLTAVPFEVALTQPLNQAYVQEWLPLDLSHWNAKLVLALLLIFLVAQVVGRPRYRLEELALFLFVAYSAFVHSRFAILYGIVLAPLLAALLARWIPAPKAAVDKHRLNAALMLIVLVAMVIYFPSQAQLRELVAEKHPVKAVAYLREHPVPGPMFNQYGFGGYLVFSQDPEHKVFIDGRGDIYDWAGVFADYMSVIQLRPNILALLQSYDIRSCLIHDNTPLATFLGSQPGWRQVYKDKLAVIFVRTGHLPLTSASAGPQYTP